MNTKWTLISSLCAFQVLYFITNTKRNSLSNIITPKLVSSAISKSSTTSSNSIILNSLKKKFQTQDNKESTQINDETLDFSQYFEKFNSYSKYFLFSTLDSEVRLVEIYNRQNINVFKLNHENTKTTVSSCWSTKNMLDKILIGAVTSNDKTNIAILYRDISDEQHYIIEYYNENISICSNNKRFDKIDIYSRYPLSSLSIHKDFIAYSVPYTENKYIILQKTEGEWNTFHIERKETKGMFLSTSLKFLNQETLIQMSIEAKGKGLFQYSTLYNIYNNETKRTIIEYQERNIDKFHNKEYQKQKIYSNGMTGKDILFEFTKGHIYHVNDENEIYLLDESSNKVEKISSDSNNRNIVIKYEGDNKLYYIKKEFSKDNSDYYSPKKTIIFDERFTEEIVSYLVNNDELIIIFKDGNIVTFALSNWFDNENLVRGLQIFLFSLLVSLCGYLIMGTKRWSDI